jgi:molybdopterin synthase catalytic subunit
MQRAVLSEDPIHTPACSCAAEQGAELIFLGAVRASEADAAIRGIDYSAYAPMALKEMESIIAEVEAAHPTAELFMQHRLGLVVVGEPSVIIRARSKHSATSFAACQQSLNALKARVPIWKKFVY